VSDNCPDSLPFTFGDEGLAEDLAATNASWIHFPARSVGRICLLANLPLHFHTHWLGASHSLCMGRGRCPNCTDGRGKKGHYAYPVYDMARRAHGAFDFTPPAYESLVRSAEGLGPTLGLTVTIRKTGGVVNGKFVVEAMHTMQAHQIEQWGDPCDTLALVCRTYDIDIDSIRNAALIPGQTI
jgi:hypothetical protein